MDVFIGISFYDRLMTQVSFIPISKQLSNVGVWQGFGVPGAATRRGGETRRGLELCQEETSRSIHFNCKVKQSMLTCTFQGHIYNLATGIHLHSEASAYWTSGVVCITHCVGVDSCLYIFEILACL